MAHELNLPSVLLQHLLPDCDLGSAAQLQVGRLCLDSRVIAAGDTFVALQGTQIDGRQFIESAIERGATLVLIESNIEGVAAVSHQNVTLVKVSELGKRLSEIAGNYYCHPARDINLMGITGTNGKTTCSQWLAEVLSGLGQSCGTVGTLGYGKFNEAFQATGMTTPDAISFQRILFEFKQQKIETVVAEVSSHSLVLDRVSGLEFDCAIVTNISRDHLDFHGDIESYALAKQKLLTFSSLKSVILNRDDAFYEQFKSAAKAKTVVSVSLSNTLADYYCSEIEYTAQGIHCQLNSPTGSYPLALSIWGEFNLSNVLLVAAAACAQGVKIENVIPHLEMLQPVSGRLETVTHGADVSVIVDFAHTPDALESVLKAIKKHSTKKLWCVFGCGGDRDSGKRSLMAAAAERYADRVVLTSDNPRTENPADIMAQVKTGFHLPENVDIIESREKAIQYAIAQASAGDIILLAGKGHEDYQIVGTEKLPFSDFKCARIALNNRMGEMQ